MKYEKVICTICKKKQYLGTMRQKLQSNTELYPDYCPNAQTIAEDEVDGILQVCEKCGMVFPRIDEPFLYVTKSMVRSEAYLYPFGKEFSGDERAVLCFRAALVGREEYGYRLAAKWFMNAALLLEEGSKAQRLCFRNAWLMIQQQEKEGREMDFELLLANLNLMRLLEMFEATKKQAKEIKYHYGGIERRLLEAVYDLALRKNSSYRTYFEMLQEERSESTQ